MALAAALRMYQEAILKEGKEVVTGTALKQALLTAIILLKLASQVLIHTPPPILKEAKEVVTGTALKQALLTAIALLQLASQMPYNPPPLPPLGPPHTHPLHPSEGGQGGGNGHGFLASLALCHRKRHLRCSLTHITHRPLTQETHSPCVSCVNSFRRAVR